jgi:site-specific recombinase XerC
MMPGMNELERFLTENPFSACTRDRYQRALALLMKQHGNLKKLSAGELLKFLDSQGWGSSSRWVAFCATRRYLRWTYGNDHPALSLRIKRVDAPPQRSLRLEQVKQLMSSFDTRTVKGIRDLAICGLFLDCGLRVSEMCRLQLRYLDLERFSLQVVVKGGQWSYRVYCDYTAQWIDNWLQCRDKIARSGSPTVFVGIGGNTPGQSLTASGLRLVVRRWGLAAGIGALSPHDLRRSMASVATVLGAPEDIAMKAGGWRSHDVFRRYTVGVLVEDFRRWSPVRAAMDD